MNVESLEITEVILLSIITSLKIVASPAFGFMVIQPLG